MFDGLTIEDLSFLAYHLKDLEFFGSNGRWECRLVGIELPHAEYKSAMKMTGWTKEKFGD